MAKVRRNPFSAKNTALLRALVYASPQQRRAIIRYADSSLIRLICECSLNVLRGNVPLKKNQKQALKKYKSTLRYLSNIGKKKLVARKKVISQRGGSILPILLAPVISAFISKAF